jgi:hypothetical protein
LADTRCSTPAFLTEDLDKTAQTVTVQIALQERVRIGTGTGTAWMDVPAIIMVPIVLPRGGGYSLTLPLKKGDEGLLVFCDTCFDFWWKNGQSGSPAPTLPNGAVSSGSQRQNEVRRHDVHDCGFVPGMYSQPHVLSNYSTDSLQLRSDDGETFIDVSSTEGITVTSPNDIQLTAPGVEINADGGTPLPLVNDNFYQWFITTYMPSVQYISAAPAPPADPETTVLKGQ